MRRPLPPPLRGPGRLPFVGRAASLRALCTAWEAARVGAGSVVLLRGDAGIGKTRLAVELGRIVSDHHGLCLYGRCDEEPLTRYQPVIEALRQLCAAAPGAVEAVRPAIDASGLPLLVPELGAGTAAGPGAELVRDRLFAAVTALIHAAATAAPVLLLLDDAHWADPAALRLAREIAETSCEVPLLLLLAYRDLEVDSGHPLARTVASLRRRCTVGDVVLSGMSEQEVADLVLMSVDEPLPADAVAAVRSATGGNPLFVEEVLRALQDNAGSGGPGAGIASVIDAAGVPRGIAAVLQHRLARLGACCNDLLEVAAVIGQEFDVPVLQSAAATGADEVVGCLEAAVRARLVVETTGVEGRFAFYHPLVREALLEGVTRARRAMIQRRVTEVLDTLAAAAVPHPLGSLADHFAGAVPGSDSEPAIEHARRAAARASAAGAHEEAAAHLRRALALVGIGPPDADETRRCDVLLALGAAEAGGGSVERAAAAFEAAAAAARTLGDPERLARAALGFAGPTGDAAIVDQKKLAMLEEAADALDAGDGVTRSRVLARLSIELYYVRAAEARRDALSDSAVAMAERCGDDAAVGYALHARHHAWFRPENGRQRLALASAMLRIAERAGDRELQLQALHWRVVDMMETGDPRLAAEAGTHALLSEELRRPAHRWVSLVLQTDLALLRGDYAAASELSQAALAMGQEVRPVDALQYYAVHLYDIARQQGFASDLETMCRAFANEYPTIPAWRCALAHILAEAGDVDRARAEFERLVADDLAALPRDSHWAIAVAMLGEVAVELGDREHATRLHDRLLPLAGINLVSGFTGHCYGPVARILGRLDALLGRWDAAHAHFLAARRLAEISGARAALSWCLRDEAAMRLARGAAGDRDAVIELLETVRDEAVAMGATALEASATRTLHDLDALDGVRVEAITARPPARAAAESRHAPAVAGELRRDGELWFVAADGDAVRLQDCVGVRYVVELVRNPGRELHALDLVATVRPGGRAPAVTPGQAAQAGLGLESNAGAFADREARAAYKRRLDELADDLARAEVDNDPERASNCRLERELLVEELTRGRGLGGRERPGNAAAERARSSVTKAIRKALDRLASASPRLGYALGSAIRTGTYCVFDPGPSPAIRWSA